MGKIIFFDFNGLVYFMVKCYFFLKILICLICLFDCSFFKLNVYIYIIINVNKLNILMVFCINIVIKYFCFLLFDNLL